LICLKRRHCACRRCPAGTECIWRSSIIGEIRPPPYRTQLTYFSLSAEQSPDVMLPQLRDRQEFGGFKAANVTAAWCLTCKANELAVLDRPPVADRLRRPGVNAIRADWTRPDPEVSAYLQSFGRYGVPLDVAYGSGARDGIVLPELLTRLCREFCATTEQPRAHHESQVASE
jgi:Thioredoxin-like